MSALATDARSTPWPDAAWTCPRPTLLAAAAEVLALLTSPIRAANLERVASSLASDF
jgi:hypothetical protein